LCGILVAGLWPFHAPRNEATWLSERNGLLFGKHGTIVSANPFKADDSQGDSSCSLEMWLEPTRVDSGGMILMFISGFLNLSGRSSVRFGAIGKTSE